MNEDASAPAPAPAQTQSSWTPDGEAAAPRPAVTEEGIITMLKTVFDSEIPVDIYELGLIYKIDIEDDRSVAIEMTLTAPGCPVAGEMPGWVADAVGAIPGVKQVDVEMTFQPQWGMDMMSDEARLELGFI